MESLYRRYHYRIQTLRTAVVTLLVIATFSLHAQNLDNFEEQIYEFLYFDYIELLQKSKDYSLVATSGVKLAESMTSEIRSLNSIDFNANALIEYDKTSNNGDEVILEDRVVPFLVNYAGRNFGKPTVRYECTVQREGSFIAYFYSKNEIGVNEVLRKAIFRSINGKLELRRISFGNILPEECSRKEVTIEDVTKSSTPASLPSPNSSSQVKPATSSNSSNRISSSLPAITIKDQLYQGGVIYLYGFIENKKENGLLTDIQTGGIIAVSDVDGYFVIKKTPNNARYLDVPLKYQYGQKFITVKKLILIN